jgi:hypothetical protein
VDQATEAISAFDARWSRQQPAGRCKKDSVCGLGSDRPT